MFPKRALRLLILGGIIPVWAGSALCSTVYVDAVNGNNQWSGLSMVAAAPDGPKQTILAALESAQDGDVIIAAPGIYRGAGNRNLPFVSSDQQPLAVTLKSEKGPLFTAIDCEQSGRALVFTAGQDNDCIVDGFTIFNARGGMALIGDTERLAGGAMLCTDSSPTIRNCWFWYNSIDGPSGAVGGAIAIAGASSPHIEDCQFSLNVVKQGLGGAVFCGAAGCDAVIRRCVFSGNQADWGGGAIQVLGQGCRTLISHCVIVGNSSGEGAGICGWEGCEIMAAQNTICSNQAGDRGGGVSTLASEVHLTNSILYDNRGRDMLEQIAGQFNSLVSVNYCLVHGGSSQVRLDGSVVLEWFPTNFDGNPGFVDPGYWSQGIWINGDYRLRSMRGHWDPDAFRFPDTTGDAKVDLYDFRALNLAWQQTGSNLMVDYDRDGIVDYGDLLYFADNFLQDSFITGRWKQDSSNSICLDAGDPKTLWSPELWPHGGRVNLGAYGGRSEASFSSSEVGSPVDIDRDGLVDYEDLLIWIDGWLTKAALSSRDFDRNNRVDARDWVYWNDDWMSSN